MTNDLKLLITKKHNLLKLANRGIIFNCSHTYFKNILTSMIRQSKNIFYQLKLNSKTKTQENPKKNQLHARRKKENAQLMI